jgi:hypothetical protein
MKRRWLVVYEQFSLLSILHPRWKPHATFGYFRWRWLAKLNVWMINHGPLYIGTIAMRATLLGRITLREATA